jgi:hypothetical protein
MFGQPLWYIGLFLLAAVLLGSFPIVAHWEQRQDERDRELWERFFGGRS